MVDGLTQTNLDALRPYWTQGGLRDLNDIGYKANLSYPHLLYGGDEATTTLLTGKTPMHHGYSMDTYFDRSRRCEQVLLFDPQQTGIGTSAQLSTKAILVPTLSDYLRLQNPDARIYAIGLRPTTTLVMAGHSADACCWLDPVSRRWVSTTYYREGLPAAADTYNQSERLTELLNQSWTPRMAITSYLHPTAQERKKGFDYSVSKHLIFTPTANTLVIELALQLQQSQALGQDVIPDLLCLELTTITPAATSDEIETAEQEDIYLHLNQDLGYLMEQLDRRIGKENYQIAVVGLPRLGLSKASLERAHIPQTEVNMDQAAALLNTYLMALYGHDRWVDGAIGQTIFLNRTLIEQKCIDLGLIQRQAANFLMEFEGVQLAYIPSDILSNALLLPSFNKKTLGDVFFTLDTDWQQGSSPLLYRSATRRAYLEGEIDATRLVELLK